MFPDLSHLGSYGFTGIYRQQTLIRKQSILLILQGQYLQHPTNPGCSYFHTFQIFLV